MLDVRKLACAESIRELFTNSLPCENISLVKVPRPASLQVIWYISGRVDIGWLDGILKVNGLPHFPLG